MVKKVRTKLGSGNQTHRSVNPEDEGQTAAPWACGRCTLTGVHVVRQPLDQLHHSAGLYDGDAGFALQFVFEHDVLLRVLNREAVNIWGGQPERVLLLLRVQRRVQHAIQRGPVLESHQRRHPRILLLCCPCAENGAVFVLAHQLKGMPQVGGVVPVHDADLPQHELLLQAVLRPVSRPREPGALIGLAADHEAIEQEVVPLVLGAGSYERPLQDELAAALADVFALPAVDALLDLVHALDGELLAAVLPAVQAVHGLAVGRRTGLA